MGIYDREYARDEPPGIFLGRDRSMLTNLLLINVGIYLLDYLFLDGKIARFCQLEPGLFVSHYKVWQLLTYGFVHVPEPFHVAFNMLMLWFFGREVESLYGRRELLSVYLSLVILAGIVTALVQNLLPTGGGVVGASGAVMGIFVIFICHDPRRTLLFWGVFPLPAWLLGTIYLVQDLLTFAKLGQEDFVGYRTAAQTHLAGAAFGYLFYRTGWSLGRLLPRKLSFKSLKPRPKLRIHEGQPEEDLNQRVDEILAKITREGEASLTKAERRVLQDASRRYQRRKNRA